MFNAIKQGMLKGIRTAISFINPGALAKLSSTQAKFGATSANFTGAANSLIDQPAATGQFIRGTQPFTFECWFYQTALTVPFPALFGCNNNNASFVAPYWQLASSSAGDRKVYWASARMGAYLSSAAIPLNTWTHAAAVRTAATGAVMATSSIAVTTGILTVGTVSSGTVSVGLYLTGTGVPAGTYIVSNISGAGAGSTWNTNTTTAVASTTITGNNMNLYINGSNVARANQSGSLDDSVSQKFRVGTWSTGANDYFTGFIDELRCSSVARYFTTFTPQTEPFIDDASTIVLMHMDGDNATQVWVDDNT